MRIRSGTFRAINRRAALPAMAARPAYTHNFAVTHLLLAGETSSVRALLMDGHRTLERLAMGPGTVSGWVRDLAAASLLGLGDGLTERAQLAILNLPVLLQSNDKWGADEVWSQLTEESKRVDPVAGSATRRLRGLALHADSSERAVSALARAGSHRLVGIDASAQPIFAWGEDGLFAWNGRVGSIPWRLEGHTGAVSGWARHDGAFWSWGEDGALIRRNGEGEPVEVHRVSFPIGRVAWTRTHVVVASEEQLAGSPFLVAFELATGKSLRLSVGAGNHVTQLLTLNDSEVVGADSAGGVFKWAPSRGKSGLHRWDAHDDEVSALSVLPDGTLLSSGGARSRLWNASGERTRDFRIPGESVRGHLVIDTTLIVWDHSGAVYLHDLQASVAGKAAQPPVAKLSAHTTGVAGAAPLGGDLFATWADNLNVQLGKASDRSVCIWQIGRTEPVRILGAHLDCALGILPSGENLWTWSLDGTLLRWAPDGSYTGWSGVDGSIEAIQERHGTLYACTSTGCMVRLDPAGLALPAGVRGARRRNAPGLRIGRHHVSATFEGEIDIVDLDTGDRTSIADAHEPAVEAIVAWDEQSFFSCGHDNVIHRWALDGRRVSTLRGHTGTVMGGLRTHTGRLLTWSWDNDLRVWDVERSRTARVLRGHEAWVWGVLDLADRWVTWDLDGGVRVWNSHGDLLAELTGASAWILGMCTAPDDRVLGWGHDGALLSWKLPREPSSRAIRPERRWKHHQGVILGAIHLEPACVVSWDQEGEVAVHRDGAPVVSWRAHDGGVEGAVRYEQGVLSWGADLTLAQWSLEGQELERVHERDAPWMRPDWLRARSGGRVTDSNGNGALAFPDGCGRLRFGREERWATLGGLVDGHGGVHPWASVLPLRAEACTERTVLFSDTRGALRWVRFA
jgi:WD40 repeat protein